MALQVKVTGAAEAALAFERLADQVEDLDSLATSGERVRSELAALSPRRTGKLAGSWDVSLAANEVTVGSELIYASVQNYGGYHNIVGLHFVERSAELAGQETERLVTEELNRLIGRL